LEASAFSKFNPSKILNEMEVNRIVMSSTLDEEYVFSSGSMQRAIYTSIAKVERDRQHLSIGRSLVKNLTPEKLKQNYYILLREGVDKVNATPWPTSV
jgi:hypothetical protein